VFGGLFGPQGRLARVERPTESAGAASGEFRPSTITLEPRSKALRAPPRSHSAVAKMPITCSPSRSPNRLFDRVEHRSTQSIRADLNRSASPSSEDFGVNGIHRGRTAWNVIKHQTANGIQEVDGSIPFGSTRLRSKLRFEKTCHGVAAGEAGPL